MIERTEEWEAGPSGSRTGDTMSEALPLEHTARHGDASVFTFVTASPRYEHDV